MQKNKYIYYRLGIENSNMVNDRLRDMQKTKKWLSDEMGMKYTDIFFLTNNEYYFEEDVYNRLEKILHISFNPLQIHKTLFKVSDHEFACIKEYIKNNFMAEKFGFYRSFKGWLLKSRRMKLFYVFISMFHTETQTGISIIDNEYNKLSEKDIEILRNKQRVKKINNESALQTIVYAIDGAGRGRGYEH